MSKTICTTVYTFDELSEEAKKKARGWFKNGGFDYDWYDSVYDDAKTIGKLMGIDINKIYFSEFYSQGDGACFEGSYRYAKGSAKAVREYAPTDKELHRIASELAKLQRKFFYRISGSVKQSGHYSHSRCTQIILENADAQGYGDSLPAKIDDAVSELLRDFMDWIYKMLRTEWEYLNSDEQVDETIRINEYNFTENGSRCAIL